MKKLLLLTLFLFLSLTTPLYAQDLKGPFVTVTLTPETNVIEPGQSLWLAIHQDIAPGWHTYFLNPGDSGAEPRVNWTLPNGMTAEQLIWPAPSRIPYAGLVNYGYEGSMTMLQKITAPDTLPDGPLTLTADLEILVCRDICIPEISQQTLTLNDPSAAISNHAASIAAIRADLPGTEELSGAYAHDDKDFIVTLSGDSIADIDATSLALFPSEWGLILNPPETRASVRDNQLILRHSRDERDLADVKNYDTIITYRTNDGTSHAAFLTLSPGSAPIGDTTSNITPGVTPDLVSSFTLTQALLFALLGGLILNLMPCVFPVLSLKALKLVSLQEKGHGKAALHGLTYTAGVLLSFAVIAGLLLSVKAAGGDVGWGFQLQNPLIILSLAYLLFVIGLNLSGFFDISGSFTNAGSSWAARHDLAGSFFTGVLATLVATPCTAPFMAGAMGFALVQPAPIAMGVFLMLGFGLALPYMVLSIVPALAKLLPRPGIWMVKFKEFLAFPMYASAAWMVWVLSMQTGPTGIMWAMSGMVSLAFAIWILTHRPANRMGRVLLVITALLALLFSFMPYIDKTVLRLPGVIGTAENHHLAAEDFSQARLDALLSQDNPVFVYMTAAWCITCKVNERVALHTAATSALFNDKNVSVLRGDWTNMNPEITAFLKHYGRSGVPLYILYPARINGDRPDPVILPQLLTPGLVADSFKPE